MTSEAMCASSVCSVRRNLRRAGTLKNRSRTVMMVPFGSADSSQRKILPPAISTVVPVVSSAARVSSSRRDTEAMDGRASPRKPESGDGEQVVDIAQLAGGVALEGEQGVIAQHAAAIVGDADKPPPAALDVDADVGGARVE